MNTPAEMRKLRTWGGTVVTAFQGKDANIEFSGIIVARPTLEKTDATNTISVSSAVIHGYAYQQYQSIRALKGKYEESPFMENFLKNIEEYNRELIDSENE